MPLYTIDVRGVYADSTIYISRPLRDSLAFDASGTRLTARFEDLFDDVYFLGFVSGGGSGVSGPGGAGTVRRAGGVPAPAVFLTRLAMRLSIT